MGYFITYALVTISSSAEPISRIRCTHSHKKKTLDAKKKNEAIKAYEEFKKDMLKWLRCSGQANKKCEFTGLFKLRKNGKIILIAWKEMAVDSKNHAHELNIEDIIECIDCRNDYKISELHTSEGFKIPAHDGTDRMYVQILYSCPYCKNGITKVCDTGDGKLVLIRGAGARLVQVQV